MDNFSEPGPSKRAAITGIADRRMRAIRQQQQEELVAIARDLFMDVDLDECLPTIEEKMECSSDDDTVADTNDLTQEVKHRYKTKMNFAEGLDCVVQYDFYVVDTCVYLDDLEGVGKLLRFCQATENHSLLVVPFQVLQELDKLKHRTPALRAKVKTVSSFFKSRLQCKDSAMAFQHLHDYLQRETANQLGDNSILQCALQVQEQVPNVGTITIVTHDAILQIKALAVKLDATTLDKLLASLSFSSSTASGSSTVASPTAACPRESSR